MPMLDDALTIPGTNVRMSVAEIFEEIDEAPKEYRGRHLGSVTILRHETPKGQRRSAALSALNRFSLQTSRHHRSGIAALLHDLGQPL